MKTGAYTISDEIETLQKRAQEKQERLEHGQKRAREAEETFEAARRGWAAEKRELERRLAASPEFRVVEQEESRSSGEDKKLEALVRLRTAELQEAETGPARSNSWRTSAGRRSARTISRRSSS